MTWGKKTGGKNWKPGQSGNPNGRPSQPEYVRDAKKLNKTIFEEILHKYVHSTVNELKSALKNDDTPAIDLCVIKILHESIKNGDQKRLEFILNRLLGKVKDEIEVTGDAHTGLMDIINKRKNGE